ncbi:Mce protein [Mycobacterium vulneris]|nr:Mce protein [Mycolicibacterium vulneris]
MAKQTSTKSRDVFDRITEQADLEVALDEQESTPETPEPAADAEAGPVDEPAAGRPRGRRRIVSALVAVVLLAAVGGSAFLGWRIKQLQDTAAAGQAALEAARNYAVTLTTLDAKDIDKHYQQAFDGATGAFKDEYTQGSAQLRQVLIDNKATGKGIVIDSAVKSATKTKVDVLLFVDQSITNAVLTSPRIDRSRVQMTMDLVDNRWLASRVEIT